MDTRTLTKGAILEWLPQSAVGTALESQVSRMHNILRPDLSGVTEGLKDIYNEFEGRGFDATLVAGWSDNINAVKVALLVDSCNVQDALGAAVSRNSLESVKLILSHSYATPTAGILSVACEYESEVLPLLLMGSRITDSDISQVLEYSVQEGYENSVQVLSGDSRLSASNLSSAILSAAAYGNLEIAYTLAQNMKEPDYDLVSTLACMADEEGDVYSETHRIVCAKIDELVLNDTH